MVYTIYTNYIIIYDFGWAGNCNLINIKVLMLFLPRGVDSECQVPLNCFGGSVFLGIKPAEFTTIPSGEYV